MPAAAGHPGDAYTARPEVTPSADRDRDTHDEVRTDEIDATGCVTLRLGGRLHHIGIGPTHTGTHVLLLGQDLDLRVIPAATGELLRQLTIHPACECQPTGRPPGPTNRGSGPPRCPETPHAWGGWGSNPRPRDYESHALTG